jgi:uncharacterized protein YkwD
MIRSRYAPLFAFVAILLATSVSEARIFGNGKVGQRIRNVLPQRKTTTPSASVDYPKDAQGRYIVQEPQPPIVPNEREVKPITPPTVVPPQPVTFRAENPSPTKAPVLVAPQPVSPPKLIKPTQEPQSLNPENPLENRLIRQVSNEKEVKSEDATPAPIELTKTETIIYEMVNAERVRRGLRPLVLEYNLLMTARKHANWMASTHRMQHGNYPVGENIAMGQTTCTSVMNTWMNSSGHRANILGGWRHVAPAAYISPSGRIYWCLQFTR